MPRSLLKTTALGSAFLFSLIFQTGCSEHLSRIVVSSVAKTGSQTQRSQKRISDFERVENICANFAKRHGMEATPRIPKYPDFRQYGSRKSGCTITIGIGTDVPAVLVTVSAAGSNHPTEDRTKIAAELASELKREFGSARVTLRVETWEPF